MIPDPIIPQTPPRLEVVGVSVAYANGHLALHDTSFCLEGGTICALVGINGSGKSTLFKSIMGFVTPKQGTVKINDLPVRTVLRSPKVTRVVSAHTPAGLAFTGYEIHMGETTRPDGVEPFAFLADGTPEGCRLPGVMGTYLHGALDDSAVVAELLHLKIETTSKSVMYDRLADWLVTYSRPDVLEALLA